VMKAIQHRAVTTFRYVVPQLLTGKMERCLSELHPPTQKHHKMEGVNARHDDFADQERRQTDRDGVAR